MILHCFFIFKKKLCSRKEEDRTSLICISETYRTSSPRRLPQLTSVYPFPEAPVDLQRADRIIIAEYRWMIRDSSVLPVSPVVPFTEQTDEGPGKLQPGNLRGKPATAGHGKVGSSLPKRSECLSQLVRPGISVFLVPHRPMGLVVSSRAVVVATAETRSSVHFNVVCERIKFESSSTDRLAS